MAIELEVTGLIQDFDKKMDRVNEILAETDRNFKKVKDSGNTMFDSAAKSSQNFANQSKKTTEAIKESRTQLSNIQKSLYDLSAANAKAMDPKFAQNFKKAIEQIRKSFENIDFTVGVDEATSQAFLNMIDQADTDIRALTITAEFAKKQLEGLAPDSKEFQELSQRIKIADEFLEEFNKTMVQGGEKQKRLRQQLIEIRDTLAKMELAGQGGTEQFVELEKQAIKLQDQIDKTSASIKKFSNDTIFIDAGVQAVTGLVGAFTAAQGAVALFGSENEELNETLLKVQSAMALLQGIQAIGIALDKESALVVVLNNLARANSVKGMLSESAVRKIVNVQTAIETGLQSKNVIVKTAAAIAQKALNAAMAANPIALVVVALAGLITTIGAFILASDDAEDSVESLNEKFDDQIGILEDTNDALSHAYDKRIEILKGKGAEQSRILKEELDRELLLIQSTNNQLQVLANEIGKIDISALDEDQLDQLQEKNDKLDALNSENLARIRKTELLRIQIENAAREERDKAAKKAEDDLKTRIQKQKELDDQLIALIRKIEDEKLSEMENGFAKERVKTQTEFDRQIQDLQTQLKRKEFLSVEAEKLANDLIIELQKSKQKSLNDLDKAELDARIQLQSEANRVIADLRADSTDKSIEIINLEFEARKKEYEEKYAEDLETQTKLITALEENKTRRIKEIKNVEAQKRLDDEEEIAILGIELLEKYAGISVKTETAKEQEILRTRILFAEKRMALLIAQGKAESDLEILQIRKVIKDLNDELNKSINSKGQKDLFDLLGLEIDDQTRQKIMSAWSSSLNQITDLFIFNANAQIEESKKLISESDNRIKQLEKELDEQERLAAQGQGNSAKRIAQQIADEKKRQAALIAEAEKALEKRKTLQKIQLALDAAAQASNLYVSATEIYKTLSPLGPVGVGIATATIIAMIAGFAASKVKALEEINKTKLEHGATGIVKGRRHSDGGENFSDHIEVESGERWSVFNRSATDKHSELIKNFTNLINQRPHIDKNGILQNLFPGYSALAMQDAKASNSIIKVNVENKELNKAAENLNDTANKLSKQTSINEYDWGTVIRSKNRVEIRKK